MQKMKRTAVIDQQIIKLYNSGLTTYQVGKQLNCSQTCVLNCLKDYNIDRRKTSSYNTKYITNCNFFNIIDSEEKAYFLGLLYADGNVYLRKKHSYELSIKLKEEDKYILEKLRDYLSPTTSLKKIVDKRTNNLHFLFKINSKKICEQLIKIGCIPNKSLLLKFPEIEERLVSHFIRGYFDGDGCIYERKPSKTGSVNYGWQITSTIMFCEVVKNYLQKLGVNSNLKLACAHSNNITVTLSVGGNNQVKKVLDWMYDGATIYLNRKYNKYIKLKSPT
jgi:intein-encoded DNA endonuclease-like protein